MNRHDLSRKQFLSLGVLGGLGLLAACTLDDAPAGGTGGGSTGNGGGTGSTSTTTTGSGGTGGTSSTTSTTSGMGGNGGSSTSSGGAAGSGGSSSAGGSAGRGGSSGGGGNAGVGGSAGSSGSGGKGGSAGAGGAKDAGARDAGSCGANPVAAISMNHNQANNGPHYLAIPVDDIAAGIEKVYQTYSAPTGTAQSHSHFVKLTAADFAALRSGMTVTKHSCDSHEHQFAFRCGTMAGVPAGTVCTPADTCGTESNPC